MRKADYDTISRGLDQLYFSPLVPDETTEDRAATIESYLQQNGWTWDQYLSNEDTKETNKQWTRFSS